MVEIEQELIYEIIEILDSLIEDIPLKAKTQLNGIISELKKPLNIEKILKIQDDLEFFSNNSNIDSYTRNEVFNVLSMFGSLL